MMGAPRRTLYITQTAAQIALVLLAALSSHLSQARLAPVFGSIPASTYHKTLLIAGFILSSSVQALSQSPPSVDLLQSVIPVHAFSIPVLSHYMSTHGSSALGPRYGPLLTELLTLFPLISGSSWVILNQLSTRRQATRSSAFLDVLQCLCFCALFNIVEKTVAQYLPLIRHMSSLTSSWSLDITVSLAYALFFPSKLLLIIFPLLYFTFCLSPHGETALNIRRLNGSLRRHGFSLLERRESSTGYISVLQNERDQYRVLRCDHSLLGGEWLPTAERARDGIVVPETIYPVFAMLEAVRLMQADGAEPRASAAPSALVV